MTNPLGLIAESRTSYRLSPTVKRGAIRQLGRLYKVAYKPLLQSVTVQPCLGLLVKNSRTLSQ